mmetsp:Transcript_21218/g.43073  ORF Transcript_21218/g.43073 Transcript_21218/m.43073 type:complete len:440 (-) Transcript_21218:2059-3378(-)
MTVVPPPIPRAVVPRLTRIAAASPPAVHARGALARAAVALTRRVARARRALAPVTPAVACTVVALGARDTLVRLPSRLDLESGLAHALRHGRPAVVQRPAASRTGHGVRPAGAVGAPRAVPAAAVVRAVVAWAALGALGRSNCFLLVRPLRPGAPPEVCSGVPGARGEGARAVVSLDARRALGLDVRAEQAVVPPHGHVDFRERRLAEVVEPVHVRHAADEVTGAVHLEIPPPLFVAAVNRFHVQRLALRVGASVLEPHADAATRLEAVSLHVVHPRRHRHRAAPLARPVQTVVVHAVLAIDKQPRPVVRGDAEGVGAWDLDLKLAGEHPREVGRRHRPAVVVARRAPALVGRARARIRILARWALGDLVEARAVGPCRARHTRFLPVLGRHHAPPCHALAVVDAVGVGPAAAVAGAACNVRPSEAVLPRAARLAVERI